MGLRESGRGWPSRSSGSDVRRGGRGWWVSTACRSQGHLQVLREIPMLRCRFGMGCLVVLVACVQFFSRVPCLLGIPRPFPSRPVPRGRLHRPLRLLP